MNKIVLSAIAALTLGSATASAVDFYQDANGQVFTQAGEGRTAVKSSTPLFSKADKIKFSGQVFLGYKYTNYDNYANTAVENDQSFQIRRGYFQVKAYLLDDPKSYYRITFDLKQTNTFDGQSVAARAKYAYLNLNEVPVGFKWFVDGLQTGEFGFGGEESAGASFLRFDGGPWSTDKDGIILNLLAAEITAVTGKDPGVLYQELTEKYGNPIYSRIDAPANREQKAILSNLSPDMVKADTLAGEAITAKLTHAPGNGAAIGGLKITTENGWFAARPSGTEDIYKIYAESFKGQEHLDTILEEAKAIVSDALK